MSINDELEQAYRQGYSEAMKKADIYIENLRKALNTIMSDTPFCEYCAKCVSDCKENGGCEPEYIFADSVEAFCNKKQP